jgi:hypothetical protein
MNPVGWIPERSRKPLKWREHTQHFNRRAWLRKTKQQSACLEPRWEFWSWTKLSEFQRIWILLQSQAKGDCKSGYKGKKRDPSGDLRVSGNTLSSWISWRREDLLLSPPSHELTTNTHQKMPSSPPSERQIPPPSSSEPFFSCHTHLWFKIDFQFLFVLDQLPMSPAQKRESEHASPLTSCSQGQFILVLKAENWSHLKLCEAPRRPQTLGLLW